MAETQNSAIKGKGSSIKNILPTFTTSFPFFLLLCDLYRNATLEKYSVVTDLFHDNLKELMILLVQDEGSGKC